MEQEEGLPISDLISLLWRRKWLFLLSTFLLLLASLIVVFKIPPTYRATGQILVEQQEIPTQWVNSTVASYADERIQAIGQRVLTTSNLVSLIEKLGVYNQERYANNLSLEALAARMRQNFSVENVRASIRDRNTGQTASATVAFRISFDHPSPEVAQDVATELVNLYLAENVQSRTKAITDTRQFLESEADRLEKSLAQIEEKISVFKEENLGALPEHQSLNITAYQRTEQQIDEIDRTLDSLGERKIILEAGIDSARRFLESGRSNTDTVAEADPRQVRLETLESELSNLESRYSDEHPDVIKKRREVAALREQIATEPEYPGRVDTTIVNAVSEQGDSSLVRLNTELASAISEEDSLRVRRNDLVGKLAELDVLINKTPEVEREYKSLIRDHENTQAKYNDIRGKQNSARVSESLELEQKGERFTLLEPPLLPEIPHKPNRKKLSILALGASLFSSFGLIFGVDWMQGKVRSVRQLERASGVPMLASIGNIVTQSDVRKRSRRRLLFLSLILIFLGALAFMFNFYEIKAEDVNPAEIKRFFNSWLDKINLPVLNRG
ncbi:MAG: hypothetical protein KTR18_04720 [Acidiferrobacterales bacterium]|nr:hypothetical protein [Acidiferrobacterales bacterium]